jgi:hypothetical protein
LYVHSLPELPKEVSQEEEMKFTLWPIVLLIGLAIGNCTTKTFVYPIGEVVVYGSHTNTDFVIISTVPTTGADAGYMPQLCVPMMKDGVFNLDQIPCHDAISRPLPPFELIKEIETRESIEGGTEG